MTESGCRLPRKTSKVREFYFRPGKSEKVREFYLVRKIVYQNFIAITSILVYVRIFIPTFCTPVYVNKIKLTVHSNELNKNKGEYFTKLL